MLFVAIALAGCREIPAPVARPPEPRATVSGDPRYDDRQEPAAAVLPLVPERATTLSVTDLDEVRRQLGVPELSSVDLMTDRADFWRRAESEAPLLTEGLLRADTAELMLDYGFTQDDVAWEARFVGGGSSGFVLAFRDDLDMGAVARAVADGVGPLGRATVVAGEHLVTAGVAPDGAQSWAKDAEVVALVAAPAEATYVRRACIAVRDALGPEATADEELLITERSLTGLEPWGPFAVAFGDHLATVRVASGRGDLFARIDLAEEWSGDDPGFSDAFQRGVADPPTGRIGYDTPRPALAARFALLEQLPFAVCHEVGLVDELAGG